MLNRVLIKPSLQNFAHVKIASYAVEVLHILFAILWTAMVLHFHQIWIVMEKSLFIRIIDHQCIQYFTNQSDKYHF